MPAKVPNGDAYQNIGGVPYVYGIGQTEITAGQYVTFLNKVDPNGQNPVQPYTGVTLWVNAFSPVLNPFSGEINLVNNATPGTHYQLAASYWANKPLVNGNMFDFAYFVNSLYNGTTVAVDNGQAKSPLGFPVHLQTRYVNLSTNISTGMYDLQDSSYPFFQRLNTSGYVIPSENEWVKAAYYSPRNDRQRHPLLLLPHGQQQSAHRPHHGRPKPDGGWTGECDRVPSGARRCLLQLRPDRLLAASL